MKVLFDHNVNRHFRRHLPGHDIDTARELGWDKLANGVLLKTAAGAGFEAFMSLDKKLEHEQNLTTLPLPVLMIDSVPTALLALLPFTPAILDLRRPRQFV